ncbi:hypothetical protein ABT330_33715 [Streptomyces sp. NPDC000658]|uniref:hypothetical protein n=1 Tax=Streptomyces sp. NPDC000658 TaxID=3154266 RepID=UPI003320A07F
MFDPKAGLTANDKTFSRAQLLAAVANALEFGIDTDPDSLERLCDDVLALEGYAVRVPTLGSTVMSSVDRYRAHSERQKARVRRHGLRREGR